MIQHVVVVLIMDMESAMCDVNGLKKKIRFWLILIFKKSDKNSKKNNLKKHIDPNCIEINLSFKIK